jgi:outer membrane receptor protein involved in Fe transport
MQHMKRKIKYIPFFIYLVVLCLAFSSSLISGTTGKLSGRILDKNKSPVIGANIIVTGTQLGSNTDIEGYYAIINIPPGKYQIKFSCIGYQPLIMKDVIISVDKTTTLDVSMTEAMISTEEVTIIAKRPVVEVNLTSSVASITSEDINVLPVQELNDIVNLQAGVIDGHFRGGRIGEVQYQVDGVSINNPYNNSSSMGLDRSLLQEVQVISGTFDAEYGQAMSGVVNVILKSGSDKFEWNFEAFSGDAVLPQDAKRFSGGSQKLVVYKFNPLANQNLQFSLSGPVFLPNTSFLLNLRRYSTNSYLNGWRKFVPGDSANFEKKIFKPTGDNKEIPMSDNQEYSGLIKLTNRAFPNLELNYQLLANTSKGHDYNFSFRENPDGRAENHNLSIIHGLDITHTLSDKTYYKLSLRQNYQKFTSYAFEDVYDPRYIQYGQPTGDYNYDLGAIAQGVDLGRWKQLTNSFLFKGYITSQINRGNLLKGGIELELPHIEFGSPGYLVMTNLNGTMVLLPRVNEPPDYPDILKYNPIMINSYFQDQIEWNELVVRAGLRMEYFDARATIPSDLENPANVIAGAPKSIPTATSKKLSFSPRLGFSYPITTTSSIFFAYGHFYQYPEMSYLFSNSDYSILKYLQVGGTNYGNLGNPNLKPQKTVQYEFGYKNALTDFLGLDLSIFYKDIRDLLGIEFMSTYAAAQYTRFTNIDFGNVTGFTIAFDQRRIGLISSTIDYTYMIAKGNSSDPAETANRAAAGEDSRPRQVPLNWDQRHTINATLSIQEPNNFNCTAIVKFGSGQPYTPSIGSGFGAVLESNSGRKPAFFIVDLRAEKYFKVFGSNLSIFARVFNLFDTRLANGSIFNDTGSPDYSLNPVGDRVSLLDPNRYYPPRRIEIGLTLSGIIQ